MQSPVQGRCAEPEVGRRLHYIWKAEGRLYVAVVLDLFSRRRPASILGCLPVACHGAHACTSIFRCSRRARRIRRAARRGTGSRRPTQPRARDERTSGLAGARPLRRPRRVRARAGPLRYEPAGSRTGAVLPGAAGTRRRPQRKQPVRRVLVSPNGSLCVVRRTPASGRRGRGRRPRGSRGSAQREPTSLGTGQGTGSQV